ncbi:MAG: hypothetical protein KDA84_29255 [Planctomycetaceae bacterium]|nr:hypothetical protein [Planctomycetaceae bacterium]
MNIRLTIVLLALSCCLGCGGSSDTQKAAVVGWAVGQGGVVHIQDQTLEVEKLVDMPKGDFEVAKIDLTESAIQDDDLQNLSVLPELTALTLHGTKISDEGLMHLTALKNLKELDLSDTNITDLGLTTLQEIKSLEKLHLHDTAVTNKGLQEFKTAVPGCNLYPAKR